MAITFKEFQEKKGKNTLSLSQRVQQSFRDVQVEREAARSGTSRFLEELGVSAKQVGQGIARGCPRDFILYES